MSVLERLAPRILRRNRHYRTAFSGPAGEFVRDDLFRLGHIGAPTHVDGDPARTAFNEGKRFMALHIGSVLNMTDEEILQRAQQQAKTENDDGG